MVTSRLVFVYCQAKTYHPLKIPLNTMNRPIFSRKKKKTAARDLNFWMMLFGDLLVQVAVEWNIGQDAAVRHAWELLSGKD